MPNFHVVFTGSIEVEAIDEREAMLFGLRKIPEVVEIRGGIHAQRVWTEKEMMEEQKKKSALYYDAGTGVSPSQY